MGSDTERDIYFTCSRARHDTWPVGQLGALVGLAVARIDLSDLRKMSYFDRITVCRQYKVRRVSLITKIG